jgi:hypothetical protein
MSPPWDPPAHRGGLGRHPARLVAGRPPHSVCLGPPLGLLGGGGGLYNRYSKDGASDIWSGSTYLRVRPWEDPELCWRYSPMVYVRNIRTPC